MSLKTFQKAPDSATTTPREQAPVPEVKPRGPKRSNNMKWLPFILVAALLLAGLAWRSRQNPAGPAAGTKVAAPAPVLTTVKTIPVAVGNISQTLDITGSLKTNQNINLSSKIIGRVARMNVQEGSRVSRGDLIVALDDADLRAQVAAAKAALRTAEVRYQQAVVGLPARVQQVGTTIEQAEAALRTAEARYRQAVLNESPRAVAAQQQVASARETVRTARARLAQARETARQARIQTEAEVKRTASGVSAAESQVTSAQSGVASAQAALADIRRGARDQQIAQAQAAVNLAQANVRDAETELNRQRMLVAGGAAPQAAADAALTRADVSRAQLESAQQNLSLVREGATNEQVRQAEEAVRRAQETVLQARQQVQQAEALRSQAEAGRGRVLTAEADITTALAGLAQAQSGLQTAEANLAQIPISKRETAAAQEAVEQARSGLSQARVNRSQIPIERENINAAAAGVQAAQAQVRQAEINLSYARIFSPVNGVVTQKIADVGSAVSPASPLVNIVSLDRVYFEALISETNVSRVKVNQGASILVPAVSSQPLTGFVSDIIPAADPRSRQFRVRITIPSAARELTPGAFARGTLTTQTVFNTLIVPSDAVQQDDKGSIVQVAVGTGDNIVVNRRKVVVGASANGKTEIRGGLVKGDRVILGNEPLDEGEKIKAVAA